MNYYNRKYYNFLKKNWQGMLILLVILIIYGLCIAQVAEAVEDDEKDHPVFILNCILIALFTLLLISLSCYLKAII